MKRKKQNKCSNFIKRTTLLIAKIDPMKIKKVADICKKHPRINRVLSEDGMLLYLEEFEKLEYSTIYRVTVSMNTTEPDQFDVGYYDIDNDNVIEDAIEMLYGDITAGYVCEQMINHYAIFHLQMPAPVEREIEYISTAEERVDMVYISERDCHSVIRKLWKHINKQEINTIKEKIGLTDKEYALIIEDMEKEIALFDGPKNKC